MHTGKNRTIQYWIDGDYVIVEERETLEPYRKGFKRKWHKSRIALTLQEFRAMVVELTKSLEESC